MQMVQNVDATKETNKKKSEMKKWCESEVRSEADKWKLEVLLALTTSLVQCASENGKQPFVTSVAAPHELSVLISWERTQTREKATTGSMGSNSRSPSSSCPSECELQFYFQFRLIVWRLVLIKRLFVYAVCDTYNGTINSGCCYAPLVRPANQSLTIKWIKFYRYYLVCSHCAQEQFRSFVAASPWQRTQLCIEVQKRRRPWLSGWEWIGVEDHAAMTTTVHIFATKILIDWGNWLDFRNFSCPRAAP